MHVFGIEITVEKLDVTTAAVDILFMLDGELKHQGFLFISELGEFCTYGVKMGILRSFNTCNTGSTFSLISRKQRSDCIRR